LRRLDDEFCSPLKATKAAAAGTVVAGSISVAWLVHATGGVQFAALHLMYLPIVFAALVYGVSGGLVAGVLAGLLLGPYMPLDTVSGEAQQAANWLMRMALFCMVGAFVGISAATLRRQLKLLDWLKDHDAGTGLLNQSGFAKLQRQEVKRRDGQARILLVVAQIKNLMDVQDTFGAGFSEKLLKQVCERARELVPADIPIALIQRDCLAVAFDGGVDTGRLRSELDPRMRSPYQVDGVAVHVDFAFGAARMPDHAETFEELLQKASVAAHTAVTRHLPRHTYDTEADAKSRENIELLGMIPAALANREFAVWHQAKLALETRTICSTEALLRWYHPRRGFIPPGTFIPRAEDSTLIDDITKWVVDTALADKAGWTARGHSLGVAINLSVRNLHQRSLLGTLHETVTRHGIAPQEVELEITESAVMGDVDYCVTLIERLRERGYRVSIDDFGTGHSSLAYLRKLPVNALKIDQAFIRNLGQDESCQKIVRAILELTASLQLECVAEGVEDEKTLTLLREWGCTYAQGYAVHRPAPADQLVAWLERGFEAPAA
jgi:predicted signal transduction protein with EAL and GGDEF domain